MKLYATVTSERASKGQGGNEFVNIRLQGAHGTEIADLTFKMDGAGYILRGWTHDNHYIQHSLNENLTKGKRQKGDELDIAFHRVNADER